MQVFKLYAKLIKKNLPSLLLYFGIFMFIVVLVTIVTKDTTATEFEQSKVNIAYINRDEESVILDGFKEYLGRSTEFVEIDESEEGMRDALFFQMVEYIIIVPDGFTDSMISGNPSSIKKLSVPDSTSSAYIDMGIEHYFNTFEDYIKNTDLSTDEIMDQVLEDLGWSTKTNLSTEKVEDISLLKFYFDYSAYFITAVLILAIGSTMLSLGNIHIKRRNTVSPLPIAKNQFQQVLCYLSFTLILDLLIISIGLFFKKGADPSTYALFSINVVTQSIAILCFAYLLGITIKNREALNGAANIFSLGFSFLSGVFVPRELLGDVALQIGKFTPTYWFTLGNDYIYNQISFTDNISNILINMAVQLGFGVAFFAIALVINKKNRTATE